MPKESAGSYVCLRQAPPGLVECEQRRIVGAVAAAEVEDPDALLVHRVRLHRVGLDLLPAGLVRDVIVGHDALRVGGACGAAGVRVGHHCAQPVMDHFGIAGTVRASFGLYNDKADIDALVQALGAVREIFD